MAVCERLESRLHIIRSKVDYGMAKCLQPPLHVAVDRQFVEEVGEEGHGCVNGHAEEPERLGPNSIELKNRLSFKRKLQRKLKQNFITAFSVCTYVFREWDSRGFFKRKFLQLNHHPGS